MDVLDNCLLDSEPIVSLASYLNLFLTLKSLVTCIKLTLEQPSVILIYEKIS